MCGITGYVTWGGLPGDDQDTITRMTAELTHRGPDGAGQWIGPYAAFGHTRLSIIDLAHGGQPMTMRGRTGAALVISYNGELYNYKKLRSELQARGRDFVTASDTEVVLQAFDEWGPACVDRFTGMFAYAIWDEATRELTLARDPLGVKPLFYVQQGQSVLFGSEEKAILAHPDIEPAIDGYGLAELFCMVPMANRDRSVLQGFRQVQPGHIMTFTANGVVSRCYWKLEALPHTDDPATTVAQVRELLRGSVQGQLVSDVPLGTLLSGGVDSSAVAALAAKMRTDGQLATFDVDYDAIETNYMSSSLHVNQDSPWARKVSEHIGSNHSTKIATTDELLAAQDHTLRIWGRPIQRTVNVSLYVLFKHIRDSGVTVVVGGEGADEAFAGYQWWREDPVDTFPWHQTYRAAAPLLRPDVVRRWKIRDYAQDSYTTALAHVPILDGESVHERRMRETSWLTYTYYLDYLLHRVDRMSMAASVEARVPFCDHELVQYAWNIPWDLKNRGGIEKGVLRDAVCDLLPNDVVMRRKSGYQPAQTDSYQRALYGAARELLADQQAPVWEVVDRSTVAELVARGASDNGEWTPLNRVAYVLETNTWLNNLGVRIV